MINEISEWMDPFEENMGSFLDWVLTKTLISPAKQSLAWQQKEEWQDRGKKMLSDKIDVTAFLVWFVENYPESAKVLKDNPDYQYKFKSAPQRNTLRCHK